MLTNSEASVYTQSSLSSVAPLFLPAIKGSWRSLSGVGSGFVYPITLSKLSSTAYTPVVCEGTADIGDVLPAPLV